MRTVTIHQCKNDIVIFNHNDDKKYLVKEKDLNLMKTWDIYDLFKLNKPMDVWKEITHNKFNQKPNVTYFPPKDDSDGIDLETADGSPIRMMFDYCEFCKERPYWIWDAGKGEKWKVCKEHDEYLKTKVKD